MGKMIDAESIVVAPNATRGYGHEGDILRYVFFHSLGLASLMGIPGSCKPTSIRLLSWWFADAAARYWSRLFPTSLPPAPIPHSQPPWQVAILAVTCYGLVG